MPLMVLKPAKPKLSTTEFNSLHDFYNATNGLFWRWHNVSVQSTPWNFSIPGVNPCLDDWQGLICNCGVTSCTVNVLYLDHHNLTGHLPDSMENFSKMSLLVLRGNNITGTITRSIGNMTDLEVLDLSYNRLYGEIPSSIGRLTKLHSLNLGVNRLTKIPEELYELRQLQGLDITINRIKYPISPRLGNLSNLMTLQLQGNGMTGSIPESIGNLQNLATLDLGGNNFHSSLPKTFYQLYNLTSCLITSSKLTGTISPFVGNLTKLRVLDISHNLLHSSIPSEIGNLLNLNILYLSNNQLTNIIPTSILNLTSLDALYLQSNFLFGKADFLSNMNLNIFYLHENFLTGTFLFGPTLFQKVTYFDLSQNSFTGPSPWQEDIEAPYLAWYIIFTNFFTGNFPKVAKTPLLRFYVTKENQITGSIPSHFFINSTRSLYYLSLAENYYSGTIPLSIGNFTKINQFDFNNNLFHGKLPETIGNLHELVVLDIDENLFTGTVPETLSNLIFLQELMIQNNFFVGNLDKLLNCSKQSFITNIDVSGNSFTGTLSTGIFTRSTQLSSFAAGNNCLVGTIPSDICQAKTLVSLTLDGLATAENCRKYLFSGLSSQFTGFVVNRFIGSTIPICLFEMPNIQLLHLSGNGLSGSIPKDLNISSSLTDLALSSNSLEGTIPDTIQFRQWDSLDLSYNKFSGTLSEGFVSISNSGELLLEVNRLSGQIPSNVLGTLNISILNGNIFQCDTLQTDLPHNDPNYNKYTCGSDSANDVLYAWLSAVIVVPLLALLVWRGISKVKTSFKELIMTLKVWKDALRSEDPKKINILRLSLYFGEVRKAAAILSIYSLIVLIPTYANLTVYSATYTIQYAWTISAMLMTGVITAIVMFVCLGVLIWLFFTLIQRVLLNIDRKAPKPVIRNSENIGSNSDNSERSSATTSSSTRPVHSALTYIIVALINLLVMGVADFSYVYIILNYSTDVVSVTAAALALFRLGTNNFILWSALPLTSEWLLGLQQRIFCNGSMDTAGSPKSPMRHYSTADIHYLENIILLNNIIIPGLAIMFTLPDCFYNALFAASSITSSYVYYSCEQYIDPLSIGHICKPQKKTIHYNPPYLYSYQCSSKIVINYVPVYAIMFLLVGIIIPIMKVFLKVCYDSFNEENASSDSSLFKRRDTNNSWKTTWRKMIKHILPEYFKGFKIDLKHAINAEKNNNDENDEEDNSSNSNNETDQDATKKKEMNRRSTFVISMVSRISRMTGKLMGAKGEKPRLFSKLTMTVQINSYLTILMCFGALFPPLALIAAMSIYSITYFEELCIGWLLTETRRLGFGYAWYEEQIERECEGVEESSNLTIWSTLVVSCCLYSYMIFDTMGDSVGWKAALPMTLMMMLMPLALFIGYRLSGVLIPYLSLHQSGGSIKDTAPAPSSPLFKGGEFDDGENMRTQSRIELPSIDRSGATASTIGFIQNPIFRSDKI